MGITHLIGLCGDLNRQGNKDIADRCYETAVFKAEQSVALIAYVREKYGDELEYLGDKFPDNAAGWMKATCWQSEFG